VAGHPQILKIDRAGKLVERIGRGAYPLGVKASLEWAEVRGTLAPGELLLLHSDGLNEARDANERYFGDDSVATIAGWSANGPAAAVVEDLVGEVHRFIAGRPAEDDISIAVIRMR
jgi:sigma-B regulation protein RsbU (phosphoserine phosphatase)